MSLISDFVQEAMPKRREDVAPFLQRVAVFTVTKAVQVTKRVVIDDIIATRIVRGLSLLSGGSRRAGADAKLGPAPSSSGTTLRGGGAHDATPGAERPSGRRR